MDELVLIGGKVVDKNGLVFSIIAVDFSKKFIIELENGKKYDASIAISKGALRFENFDLQKQVEEKLEKMRLRSNQEVVESDFNNRNELSEDEAKRKLLAILEKYGFEGFLHTTELENFQRIIISGYLLSRKKVEEFIDKADKEVIEQTTEFVLNCCRFYYYFKTPTNYRAGYSKPVILVFDKELIFKEKLFFSEGNAASKFFRPKISAKDALSINWHGVFERGAYSSSKYVDSMGNNAGYVTRIRNSECLIRDKVDIKYIDKVYFKTETDYHEAKSFSPEWLSKKFFIDRSKFFDD